MPPRREQQIQFGVRHPVKYTEFDPTPGSERSLEEFFYFQDKKWRKITLTELVIGDQLRENPQRQFVVYNDPEKLGMTVMENRIIQKFAKSRRLRWNSNDRGRLGQDLRDSIAGLDQPARNKDGLIEVMLTDVMRVGAPNAREEGRKIALIADQSSPEAEYMLQEHELVTEALGNYLGFEYPYEEYLPKFTIGKVIRSATEKHVGDCVRAVRELLPLTVQLEPVLFFSGEEAW